MRVGIEVGGTFTDLIVMRDGARVVAKVPSTPESPDIGAINAIDAAGIALSDVDELVHGSTVATNAVLERKGANVAMLVTRGTRDLLALQRHDRSAIYDLKYKKPEPIVARDNICELDERMAADGSAVQAPDVMAIEKQLRSFFDSNKFGAVAVCLLNSYANSAHERLVAQIVRQIAPDIPITCSVDVAPEFREYERASTTVLAAFVQPVIDRYLNRLVSTINERGFRGRFSVMQSNGGRLPAAAMARNAVSALYSGPAAGVVGATGVAGQAGFPNIITLDMGGTSTDVSLVVDGAPQMAGQTRIDGLPVRTPVIDIVTVGAGGGSVAWLDDGGLMRVGPQSAGATPGPACYARGGTQPTVTDAHLVRGTLRGDSFLGGKMALDDEAAENAFSALSRDTGMVVGALADAVIQIAESSIVRAIQQVSTERGHDPRDFVLVPFGGAGGLHAARVAEELGIDQILVPANAGVLSAVGLLSSDYVTQRSRTERLVLSAESLPVIERVLNELREQVTEYMDSQDINSKLSYEPVLEMRYVGQAFEVPVNLPDQHSHSLSVEQIASAFAQAHHRVFEFSKPPEKAVEIVTFRVSARAASESLVAQDQSEESAKGPGAATVSIVERGQTLQCEIVGRRCLVQAQKPGPLLIDDGTASIYVPPGWLVQTDSLNNLVLTSQA